MAVTDVPSQHHYEISVGGMVAGRADYRLAGRRLVLRHTEIGEVFEGRGLGGRLLQAVIDDVRARGLTLTPICPFLVSYLERHPDQQDVVDPEEPGGLAAPAAR